MVHYEDCSPCGQLEPNPTAELSEPVIENVLLDFSIQGLGSWGIYTSSQQ